MIREKTFLSVYQHKIPANSAQEVLLPGEELDGPHAVKHLRHELDPLVLGRHHLGAQTANLVGDALVDGDEEDGDDDPGQKGDPDLLVEKDQSDAELERETPGSVEAGTKVENSVRVCRHEVDDLTGAKLAEAALGDGDGL